MWLGPVNGDSIIPRMAFKCPFWFKSAKISNPFDFFGISHNDRSKVIRINCSFEKNLIESNDDIQKKSNFLRIYVCVLNVCSSNAVRPQFFRFFPISPLNELCKKIVKG